MPFYSSSVLFGGYKASYEPNAALKPNKNSNQIEQLIFAQRLCFIFLCNDYP
jgi:hypothetical protein